MLNKDISSKGESKYTSFFSWAFTVFCFHLLSFLNFKHSSSFHRYLPFCSISFRVALARLSSFHPVSFIFYLPSSFSILSSSMPKAKWLTSANQKCKAWSHWLLPRDPGAGKATERSEWKKKERKERDKDENKEETRKSRLGLGCPVCLLLLDTWLWSDPSQPRPWRVQMFLCLTRGDAFGWIPNIWDLFLLTFCLKLCSHRIWTMPRPGHFLKVLKTEAAILSLDRGAWGGLEALNQSTLALRQVYLYFYFLMTGRLTV